jgi:hypothetical protein
MNEFNINTILEKNTEQVFLKDLSTLINNAKEIEKQIMKNENQKEISNKQNIHLITNIDFNTNNNIRIERKNENIDKKSLERQLQGLKYILKSLEKNYDFISPYHDELNISHENGNNMTEEISKQIINLYISKKFNSCYNLWRNYDFKMLIGVSPERSFDMLKYLNKLRDRYERRSNIIESINKINLSNLDNNNCTQSEYFSNSNFNNISNYKNNNSQINSSDIYNLKLNENEQFTQKLREQIDSIKRIHNFNK